MLISIFPFLGISVAGGCGAVARYLLGRTITERVNVVVLQERERKQDEQRMPPLVQFRQALQTAGQPRQPGFSHLL